MTRSSWLIAGSCVFVGSETWLREICGWTVCTHCSSRGQIQHFVFVLKLWFFFFERVNVPNSCQLSFVINYEQHLFAVRCMFTSHTRFGATRNEQVGLREVADESSRFLQLSPCFGCGRKCAALGLISLPGADGWALGTRCVLSCQLTALIRFSCYSMQSSSWLWIVLKALITPSSHATVEASNSFQVMGRLAMRRYAVVLASRSWYVIERWPVFQNAAKKAVVKKVCYV